MTDRMVVRGGLVIGATGSHYLDLLVVGDRIEAVTVPGSETIEAAVRGGADVVDATDRYVLPGGVDVHTHCELDVGAFTSVDTFASGTRAAAIGGTTTIVDFVTQAKGEHVRAALDARAAAAAGQCVIDYGFHMIVGDATDEAIAEIPRLVDEGITSIKLFMAYPDRLYSDDGRILLAMQAAASCGSMVMMHAENGIAIDVLAAQAVARGDVGPVHHARTRPPVLEAEATYRAIALAEVGACPLYIVHLSASGAMANVAAARERGANVFAETCPQYLYLSLEEHLDRPGVDGAAFICSTPLRSHAEGHQRDLWTGLRTDALSVVATDHCPFCLNDKRGVSGAGLDDFRAVPNGLGTIEHRMDLLFQGVVGGRLTLERWVELCCTTPARLFGLDRKGVIRPGADADIVVYDPDRRHTISAATHHMAADHSAFEGVTLTGGVDLVVSRGRRVVERGSDGTLIDRTDPTHGRYVARHPSAELR